MLGVLLELGMSAGGRGHAFHKFWPDVLWDERWLISCPLCTVPEMGLLKTRKGICLNILCPFEPATSKTVVPLKTVEYELSQKEHDLAIFGGLIIYD